MTQTSIIQSGHINTWPTSDVGPYTARQWADRAYSMHTANMPTRGVIPLVGNELTVTEAPANQINVDTGDAQVSGHYFSNDASVAFTPGAPAANPRIDIVVLVQNNTGVQRTAGIATPNNLIFPTVLTDYAGSASIEPFTARLAILPGNEAAVPVAPTLDVDNTTLFMIPLAQYDIAVGGAVTGLVDLREPFSSPLGSVVKLDEQILTAGAITVSFTGISQLFRNLMVVMNARGGGAGLFVDTKIQFNGDAGNNYDTVLNYITGAGVSGNSIFATATFGIVMGGVVAGGGPANYSDSNVAYIPNYNNTSFYKTVTGHGTTMTALVAASMFTINFSGYWRNTAAITRVDVSERSGTVAFDPGSSFSLYGLT